MEDDWRFDDDVEWHANANASEDPGSSKKWRTRESDEGTFVSARDSIARARYAIDVPSGWEELVDVASARVVGVDASWRDGNDLASTLAVFVKVDERRRTVREKYGTIEEDARRRAESAQNQRTLAKRVGTIAYRGRALETHEIETEVGAGSAGRFGSAIEVARVFIVPAEANGGDGGWEVFVRATASGSSWRRVQAQLRQAVESFRFVDDGGG